MPENLIGLYEISIGFNTEYVRDEIRLIEFILGILILMISATLDLSALKHVTTQFGL